MAGKITDLTAIGAIDRATDLLEIVDSSANASKKVTVNNLIGISGGDVLSTTDSQTIQNKVIDASNEIVGDLGTFVFQKAGHPDTLLAFDMSLITNGNFTRLRFPNESNVTISTDEGTGTLLNKTITSPLITLPTIVDFSHAQHDHSSPAEGGLIAGGSGGSILLQTNDNDNDSQIKLNLVEGANISLTDNGAGAIEIAAAGGGGGEVIAIVTTAAGTSAETTSASIPYDDTIPQITEGAAISAVDGFSFTGTTADSVMIVEFDGMFASSASTDNIIVGIFITGFADAVGVGVVSTTAANQQVQIRVRSNVAIGTNTYAFHVRYGTSNSGTITFGGAGGSRKLGATNQKSFLTFTECLAEID